MAANEKSGSFYLQSKVYRCAAGLALALALPLAHRSLPVPRLLLPSLTTVPSFPFPPACLPACSAKERLEQEFQEQGRPTDTPGGGGGEQQAAGQQQQQQGGGQ